MLGLPLDSWLLILCSSACGPALVLWFYLNQRRNRRTQAGPRGRLA